MTVSTEVSRTRRAWAGSLTPINTGLPALAPDHVAVVGIDPDGVRSNLAAGVHFTLSLSSGIILFHPVSVPPSLTELEFTRATPALQGVAFVNGAFDASVHERLHDAAAMRAAEARRDLADAILRDIATWKPDAFGTLDSRFLYDEEPRGFTFLQTDDEDGRPIFFLKNTDDDGDWSDPLVMSGPPGLNGANPTGLYLAVGAGGTADALTGDFTPNVLDLAARHSVVIEASAANTGAATFSPDGLTAKPIVKGANIALAAGDIAGAGHQLYMTFSPSLDKWVLANPATGVSNPVVPRSAVRQTVQAGPMGSGLPNLLPSTTGALSISTQNVSSLVPLVVSAAQGFDAAGDVNSIGYAASNLTWSGLASGATSFLYLTIAANGVMTPAHSTLAPNYIEAGAPSTANGQLTFVINEMTMYLGDGTNANKVFAVVLGEVVTSGSGVTSSIAYAYNGRSEKTTPAPLPVSGGIVNHAHNIGVLLGVDATLELVCVSADYGYGAGDVVENPYGGSAGGWAAPISLRKTRNLLSFRAVNLGANTWGLQNYGTGALSLGLDVSKWDIRTRVRRAW